ncbi:hypothetical protein M0R45_029306 [Rubus argutus]|uniref:Uncharacterized protein n=1 Tax=Rubus argutus TaxID=59490 RepID=A0AAW1WBR1_RUBAR
MTKLPLFAPLFVAVLVALVSLTAAEIKSLTISSDTRPMILFEKFGFTHTGHVTIRVSSVSVTSKQTPQLCVLESRYITPLFDFRSLSPPPKSTFNQSYPVSAPNEYSLFFANCAPDTTVSMDVHTEVYNLDPDGSRDYLSAGLTHLPSLFFVFSLAYLVFLGVWIYLCYTHKLSVHRIHILMAGLLLTKALNLICAAEDKHYVKVTGTAHGWDVLFYIFQFLRVVLLFTVIVLIGTGWSFEAILARKGKEGVDDCDPSSGFGQLGFRRDRSLRETSKTDGKAARNLAKLTLFRQFYIVVIGYLYFTRIVVFALKTIAAYKYQWVSNAAEETASLVFYMVMFYMFRPVERNEYLILDDEEEEAAEMALRDEEFEL